MHVPVKGNTQSSFERKCANVFTPQKSDVNRKIPDEADVHLVMNLSSTYNLSVFRLSGTAIKEVREEEFSIEERQQNISGGQQEENLPEVDYKVKTR